MPGDNAGMPSWLRFGWIQLADGRVADADNVGTLGGAGFLEPQLKLDRDGFVSEGFTGRDAPRHGVE
jgi:hypothetical protein